jgi:SRSO17 transposase
LDLINTVPKLELTIEAVENLCEQLQAYHGIYAHLFARREQREWSEKYLLGLLSDVERKSIEPMVLELFSVDANAVRGMQQFVSSGAWEDSVILQQHWQEVDHSLGSEDGTLIVDGSDFLKQGSESVGVKRQYCGEVGKRANCQAGVFLAYASDKGYTLLDRRLYLPDEWANCEAYAHRREKCGVPDDYQFQTKPKLAIEMIRKVCATDSLRCQWVTADEAFGRDTDFLDAINDLGLFYFAQVPHDTQVWTHRPLVAVPPYKGRGRKPTIEKVVKGQPMAQNVASLAQTIDQPKWNRYTIKEGSKGPIVADFAFLRVIAKRDQLPGPEVWLILRRTIETGELKTYLSNAPVETPMVSLVRQTGMRWPIETSFEQGKQMLGMRDYEVRSWTGWHHHMTLVILAHFFLVRLQLILKKTPRL